MSVTNYGIINSCVGRSATSKPKRSSRWKARRDTGIELSEEDGVLSLHLGSSMVQSAMRIERPDDLEIAYTRCMMGFLLVRPQPRDILMVGLGGGSLVKFIHRHLPKTLVTAVEINPQVIVAARSFFGLPPESERLQLVEGDGGEYVAGKPECCDVLMVDGFDDGALPAALGSDEFFAAAAATLRPAGVMVMNLLGRDRRLKTYLKRAKAHFPGGVFCLKAEPDDNLVIFGLLKSLDKRQLQAAARRAVAAEKKYGFRFRPLVKMLAG